MTFAAPMPFAEALQFAREKELLPTTLSSAQLSKLGGDLKRRATFSARISRADLLQFIHDSTEKIAGGITEGGDVAGAHEDGDRMLSIPEAKAQLKEMAQAVGWEPENPEDIGTIKDIRSDSRLQLVVETNVLDTMNGGRWIAGQDAIALDVNPAQEMVRMGNPKVPRDWPARWNDARSATIEDGATDSASGRMVALKNHPIWQALGDGAGGYTDTLGNPWAPFAFLSQMNTIDVPRDEAVALNLLTETTLIDPESRGLNDGLDASAERFGEALQRALADDPGLHMDAGVLTLKRRGSR